MEKKNTLTEDAGALLNDVKEYAATSVALVKLDAAEKISVVTANTAAVALIAVLLLCFVAFAGVGLAILTGTWMHRIWAGFLAVSGLYGLTALLIWKLRERWIRIPVMNHLLKTFLDENKTGTE